LVLIASPSFAENIIIDNPIKSKTFEELIANITNFVFLVSIALAPLMIILAGFYYMTANGEPEKIKKAKDIMLYTVIGIAVVLLSRAFVSMIKGILESP
jgi:hypothetical protein